MPFVGVTYVGPKNHILHEVNIGRIHSQLQGVTRPLAYLSSAVIPGFGSVQTVQPNRALTNLGPTF